MLISEAVEKAKRENKYITRQKLGWVNCVKIKPTDTSDCCIVMQIEKKSSCRGWQPYAEDLVANDWMVLD